eukprot:CAMPEP_0176340962 /NCGR_PEP_ID=MMETSP0126-20121128/1982_1 /TAXON_ID=141414 ORGANISM="Strombidinopsis acuminatum, Strain SPMC142" /NCGR_SAMPLE_ID=MMETSP0126 /ASSEMBLY_ACC=CAM_ASM_000229 /LENGTH=39 /DNA_ID= /DNA_START= /DNA_END= /DNA_ORIENTATION=
MTTSVMKKAKKSGHPCPSKYARTKTRTQTINDLPGYAPN